MDNRIKTAFISDSVKGGKINRLKQKIDQLTVSYDKDADVLYITEGKPREAR